MPTGGEMGPSPVTTTRPDGGSSAPILSPDRRPDRRVAASSGCLRVNAAADDQLAAKNRAGRPTEGVRRPATMVCQSQSSLRNLNFLFYFILEKKA